jgi:hypothetical protein
MKQLLIEIRKMIGIDVLYILVFILVCNIIAAVFRVNSKKCSASVYSSNIRENTEIFDGRSLSSGTDHRDG